MSISSDINAEKKEIRRPRIGLVLSGGGARGLAHIGVIKVLEQYGIRADYVVGTSMGSLVGGLYSSGYNAAALEKTALSIDWEKYLDDRNSRRDLSYNEKQNDGRFIISLPFNKSGSPEITGIIEGVRLHAFLNRLLLNVQSTKDFNSLPIPFACIATDIYTGEAVILNQGHLPTALRASMAIPSIFTPVNIDGRLLVDGGLILNFPVSVARDMGADVIIGVDVGTPLHKKGETLTIPGIIDQITSFRGSESTAKQRNLCNILITPELDEFSSSDFNKTAELIAKGEKAALFHSKELTLLADSQNRFSEPVKKNLTDNVPDNEHIKKIYISRLKVEGLKKVSRQLLDNNLQIKIPSYITTDDIEKAIARTMGSKFFKSVTYRLDREEENNILIIQVEETAVDFLNAGLRYDSDLKAAILINTEFKNVAGEGSRVDFEAILGDNPAFRSSYLSGTGWPIGAGYGAKLWYERIDVYSYLNNDISGEYEFRTYGLDTFLYMLLYHNLYFGLGFKKEFMRIDNVITMEKYSESTLDYLNPYLFLHLDTIDRAFFPRSGIMFNGEAMHISDMLSLNETGDASIQRYFLNTEIYIPVFSRLTFLLTHFFGMTDGEDIPPVYYFAIGGLNNVKNIVFPFIGLGYMEATGTNIHAAGTGLQCELFKNFYLTPKVNVARIKDSTKDVLAGNINTVYGYGITTGYLSILGPVQVSVSRGSNHKIYYHFNIGFMF